MFKTELYSSGILNEHGNVMHSIYRDLQMSSFPDFLQRQKVGHFIPAAEGKSKHDVRVEASGNTQWQLQALPPLPPLVATPRLTHLGSPKH